MNYTHACWFLQPSGTYSVTHHYNFWEAMRRGTVNMCDYPNQKVAFTVKEIGKSTVLYDSRNQRFA